MIGSQEIHTSCRAITHRPITTTRRSFLTNESESDASCNSWFAAVWYIASEQSLLQPKSPRWMTKKRLLMGTPRARTKDAISHAGVRSLWWFALIRFTCIYYRVNASQKNEHDGYKQILHTCTVKYPIPGRPYVVSSLPGHRFSAEFRCSKLVVRVGMYNVFR